MSTNEVQQAVARLKLDGYQVRFTHWRRTPEQVAGSWGKQVRYSRKVKWMYDGGGLIEDDDFDELVTPLTNGGMTQCSILRTWHDENGADAFEELMAQSHTNCSKDDQFCYAQGRRISLARAIKNMEVELPYYLDKAVYDPIRGELWRHTRNGLK